MIGSLRGTLLNKSPGDALVEVNGIGYEVSVPLSAYDRLPEEGSDVQMYISESMGMYGGGITLYGFLSLEDKEIYLLLREIPGTGAKKALDYLDKIMKSAPDFRRAVLEGDVRALVSLFGFTRKTADKIVAALKDRMGAVRITGREKWSQAMGSTGTHEAIAALVHLGYRESEARAALEQLPSQAKSSGSTAELIREALKQLS
ncbi:MAG: Holliday junction branch migration protein RuvA [Elusimicrobiota bacterium]|jgi:Holliday junction DNA helicase RuvA